MTGRAPPCLPERMRWGSRRFQGRRAEPPKGETFPAMGLRTDGRTKPGKGPQAVGPGPAATGAAWPRGPRGGPMPIKLYLHNGLDGRGVPWVRGAAPTGGGAGRLGERFRPRATGCTAAGLRLAASFLRLACLRWNILPPRSLLLLEDLCTCSQMRTGTLDSAGHLRDAPRVTVTPVGPAPP